MMERNKDEAIRAKDVAEKMMQNNDFEGACRIAQKAQQLFPELENINQLLTICNVHLADQNKILGSEKDLYGILQLDKFADEVAIRKQYRKLALTLHPDKNKLPGAEAAFKLVGEANVVLLDPGKKTAYDSKYKAVRTANAQPPPYQYNSLNRRQTMSKPSVLQEAFWTACPYCKTMFQYLKKFVNHLVHCQVCKKQFTTYEQGVQLYPPNMGKPRPKPMPTRKAASHKVSDIRPRTQGMSASHPHSQGVPSTASRASGYQTSVFPPKDCPHPSSSSMDLENIASAGLQGCDDTKTASSELGMTGRAAVHGEKVKSENEDDSNLNSVVGGNHEGMPAHKKQRESGTRNNGRKRGRKHVVESSESGETSHTSSSKDTNDDVFEEDCPTYSPHLNSGVDGAPSTRRSFRRRQSVLYNENGSDEDDAESPSKRASKNKSSGNNVVKEAAVNINAVEPSSTSAVNTKVNANSEGKGYSEKSFSNGTSQTEKLVKTTVTTGHGPSVVEILDDFESDADPDPDGTTDTTVYYCPDPDFTDFDKEKEEHCFAVDQIWALYDTIDGMPRFYAQIKKVYKPGFKVLTTWLEGFPEDDREISWLKEELPFGCGRFEWGDSKITADRLSFSHQVHFEKDKKGTSVFIRPWKGEIWALFKDWNINWNCEPENHRMYKYEIVEVISDFSEDAGIRVCYLDKVRGFVSLFQRASVSKSDFLLIRPDQLLRFSHSIPSCKMSGTEREGVPVGCFELDPAALPLDPDDICYPLKVTSAKEFLQKGINLLDKKSENVVLPGKYGDGEGKRVTGLNADFLRLSPRGIKMNERK